MFSNKFLSVTIKVPFGLITVVDVIITKLYQKLIIEEFVRGN